MTQKTLDPQTLARTRSQAHALTHLFSLSLSFSCPLFSLLIMDIQVVFTALEAVCNENITVLSGPPDLPYGDAARRLVTSFRQIQEHSHTLEPVVLGFTTFYHHYDFDAHTPGNGYRTLVKVQCSSSVPKRTLPLFLSLSISLSQPHSPTQTSN